MSKLARKFVFRLSALLTAVVILAFCINANFIGRYYLYREKKDLNRVCGRLQQAGKSQELISQIEAEEDVVVAVISNTSDNILVNERLRQSFLDKGLGLSRFWLWDQDQQEMSAGGSKMRLYNQPGLRYSILVAYLDTEDTLLAAARIIPAMEPVIRLINQVLAVVMAGAVLLMVFLIHLLVKKITTPLAEIGRTAQSIASLDFKTVPVKTGDELELLAEDINQMSIRLSAAHNELEGKNRRMEALMDNVSHDLKTPISLIKAYACGIKDGLDDGTFLDTVISQNEIMEQMVERLLYLSRLKQKTCIPVPLNVSQLSASLIQEYEQPARESGLTFQCDITSGLILTADEETLRMLLSNLISNAVKYASGSSIQISLQTRPNDVVFMIQNQISALHPPDPKQIWEPFYVGEASRNKHMSGTGLGLYLVKTAALRWGYGCTCQVEKTNIIFELVMSNPCHMPPV